MSLFWSILTGKIISDISKRTGRGLGKSAPGLYALKIDNNLVSELASQIPINIIVTGTNGKSTTSRLLSGFLRASGFRVVNNLTGSNLERGIASELTEKANFLGRIKSIDYGVWEVDEGAFVQVAQKLKPKMVVVLNALRDQLDRYGEVDTIVAGWKKSLEELPDKPVLVLNGDDRNVMSLSSLNKKESYLFGVEEGNKIGDEAVKKPRLRPKIAFLASGVVINGLVGSRFLVVRDESKLDVSLPMPGLWHIYDFLAAYASAELLGIKFEAVAETLQNYSPIFGRAERIVLEDGSELILCLIKNPTGASEVLKLLSTQLRDGDSVLLCLNDNLADGRDVSWIWDSEFEKLPKNIHIVCSGLRAEDMALRLKYAGLSEDKIQIYKNVVEGLEEAIKRSSRVYALPTYTALLHIEKILRRWGVARHYQHES